MKEPITLAEVKTILAEKVYLSKSKLQDILNAVVRSGCLVDEKGEMVRSFTVPFANLVSLDPGTLEERCIESYVYAVLRADPTFFDSEENIAEFEEVTGGKMPDLKTIELLKERIQREIESNPQRL